MKKYVFIALFFTAFMFPFFGSITNADALGNYGCGNPDRKTHVNCLRGLLDTTPYGLTVPKGPIGLGQYGCGKKAGNIKKRKAKTSSNENNKARTTKKKNTKTKQAKSTAK